MYTVHYSIHNYNLLYNEQIQERIFLFLQHDRTLGNAFRVKVIEINISCDNVKKKN